MNKDLEYLKNKLIKANITYRSTPIENIDKKLKALEIIKKKGINIQELEFSCDVNEYNIWKHSENKSLTQEEYDLLKEVLL